VTLEIPDVVVLAGGSTGQVKRVSATVTEGTLTDVVYIVETEGGAWVEVPREDARPRETV
jgi:hypothetical protein